WSANQWQVTPDYPYYLGTANFYDPGYRANEIHRVLSAPGKLSAADMAALQTDTRDFLASEIVPVLLQSLSSEQLNPTESAARDMLQAGTIGWRSTPPRRRSGGRSGSRTWVRPSTHGGSRGRSK